jgi:hypothetical protein
MLSEARARELQDWVAATVARVETALTAEGGAGAGGEGLKQRLGDVRDMLDGILGDLRGAEHGAKKARTHSVLEGDGRELAQMSALLAQMRAE